jgi:bacterioferritin (cytochrome b1)
MNTLLIIILSNTTLLALFIAVLKYLGRLILKDQIESVVKEELSNELGKHRMECKIETMEKNDARYLSREEFKTYISGQIETNKRLEQAIEGIRDLCDKILLNISR